MASLDQTKLNYILENQQVYSQAEESSEFSIPGYGSGDINYGLFYYLPTNKTNVVEKITTGEQLIFSPEDGHPSYCKTVDSSYKKPIISSSIAVAATMVLTSFAFKLHNQCTTDKEYHWSHKMGLVAGSIFSIITGGSTFAISHDTSNHRSLDTSEDLLEVFPCKSLAEEINHQMIEDERPLLLNTNLFQNCSEFLEA